MRLVPRLLWLFGLWAFPILACNDLYTPPETAPLELLIKRNASAPLEGVEVCEGDSGDNCALSDADGLVALDVPVDQEIFYTLKKEGYDSILFADVIPEAGLSTHFVMNGFENEVVADLYADVMSPYPRLGTGEIFMEVRPLDFPGATFELVDATGKAYYQEGRSASGDLAWRLDLTETTSVGAGGFVEVTPGTFYVKLGGTATGDCVPFWGWPSDVEKSVRVPVREGGVSYVQVICPPPP